MQKLFFLLTLLTSLSVQAAYVTPGNITTKGFTQPTAGVLGATTAGGAVGVIPYNSLSTWEVLNHAGTLTLDMSSETSKYVAITGNVTIAFSNIATNRSFTLVIRGCSTNSVPTFPAGSVALGGNPGVITAEKISLYQGFVIPPGVGATNVLTNFLEEQP